MNLYREEILDHWQNPQNFGKMAGADMVVRQINPLCGDQVTFYFKINHGKIEKVSFTGEGCAISIASASMLSGAVKGKDVIVLSKLTGQDVLAMIGGAIAPARLKCAFLALDAIRRIAKLEARNPKSETISKF